MPSSPSHSRTRPPSLPDRDPDDTDATDELVELALRVQLPGFPGTTLARDVAALLAEGLGGVCLFGSNTAAGPAAVAELTSAIHAAGPGAVVAVDEEGGDVTRLHAMTGSPVLGPAALGAVDDLELTRATGRIVGAELAAVGIDLDLAPVADVNSNPDNPVIGTRSFGTDPAAVAAHAVAWAAGLQEAGVAACAKHFPGHGDTGQDSHLELPTIDVDLATLAERELLPFGAVVEAGVASVMTSHIVVTAVDPDRPATLSRPVLALLRERLGYDGVVVSDALDMAGASAGRGIPEAAVLALDAGADLLCLGADKDVALVREVQSAIVDAVGSGRLSEERLRAAAARVALLRRPDAEAPSHAGPAGLPAAQEAGQLDGARRALVVEGTLPDLTGATVVSLANSANIAVGEVPWGLRPDRTVAADAADAAEVPGSGPVVVQVRDAHRRPAFRPLLDGLVRAGRPVLVVEWGWPGEHDGASPRICTRGCSRPATVAVTELLRKAGWDR